MNKEPLKEQIGRLRHGTHICAFYKDSAEAAEILVPWVYESFARDEGCVYVTDDRTAEDVTKVLATSGVDVEREFERRSLQFMAKSQWRHADSFDQDLMAEHVKGVVNQAVKTGLKGLWVAVEMAW